MRELFARFAYVAAGLTWSAVLYDVIRLKLDSDYISLVARFLGESGSPAQLAAIGWIAFLFILLNLTDD